MKVLPFYLVIVQKHDINFCQCRILNSLNGKHFTILGIKKLMGVHQFIIMIILLTLFTWIYLSWMHV